MCVIEYGTLISGLLMPRLLKRGLLLARAQFLVVKASEFLAIGVSKGQPLFLAFRLVLDRRRRL